MLWCEVDSGYFSFDEFISVSQNYDYNGSYGSNYIKLDFKIIGKDWWLERSEYDGAEWWEFKSFPKKPKNKGNADNIFDKSSEWSF